MRNGRKHLVALILTALLPASLLFCSASLALESEVAAINQIIQNKGALWYAAETPISRLPSAHRQKRLGLRKPALSESQLQAASSAVSPPLAATLPASLDYTAYNYVTSVKDQDGCGGCWAYATAAALESQLAMATGSLADLSEQVLISCSGAGDCGGGYIDTASTFIRETGLPLEECFPTTNTNESCSNAACENWTSSTYKITGWHYVTTVLPTASAIKTALYTYGPLVTSMDVYSDFYTYSGGIYSYVTGTYEGGHSVEIVGYDDGLQCFIAKNSWGTGWGENGYFRIAYGELNTKVQFGYYTLAYEGYNGTVVESGALSVTINPTSAIGAGAKWRVDNGTWRDSGTIASGLAVGQHTVDFLPITGWTTPANQTVTIENGKTTSTSGTYVQSTSAGSLTVVISPVKARQAGARWRVDGGVWRTSGTTVSNLTAGQHTVEFNTISGWTTPANQTVTVVAGQTASTSGTYVQQSGYGSLTVTISPEDAVSAGAQWRVDSGVWRNSGTTVSGLAVGTHTVDFSSIAGWSTPSTVSVTIVSDQNTAASGTYIQLFGSLCVTLTPQSATNAGAKWQVDGGTWRESGMTATNLTVGIHTVSFSNVTGWITPATQTVSISDGQTATAQGAYAQLGSLTVTITPEEAVSAGGMWRVDGGQWRSSGTIASNLTPGAHTVEFLRIKGWYKPSRVSVTVPSGGTAVVSIRYVRDITPILTLLLSD